MKTLKFLGIVGLLAILAAIWSAAFFFGGWFSVGATAEDPGIVNWALINVRQASIARHAATAKPPEGLAEAATVEAGARAFAARGCANCHGGPGVDWAKFAEGLRPDPPDLKEVVKARTPSQLFWVVKNGIKMTGMPSFALAGVDDKEIWTIVAFLTKLPSVSDSDYKSWTAPPPVPAAAPAPPAADNPPEGNR